MSAASIGPQAHSQLPSDKVMQGTLPTDLPLPGWSSSGHGMLVRWLGRFQQARRSPARGLLFGFGLSALLWAAIIGFILAL
ncbi:hypothetical protein [Teichococcus vastitatis]|uniref:hypothetical protein n=1 Tax=Teichococcus vastitatis TaxID=2307076 RepID=UPI000E74A48C|nr:hypothetical protein [Pseudoroseomonas vastitatis]